jgi:colanic acid/amylovoran biosynthesis glycosyltransferase
MKPNDSNVARPAIAYLQSQYPMLSMIFVIREVLELKRLGFRIDVASINSPDRARQGLTADERAESEHTYYVKAHGVAGAVAAHLTTALRRPGDYVRGWALVARLGGSDLAGWLRLLAYFTEGLMVGRWMGQRQLTHVHAHLGSQAATVGLFVKRVFGVGFSITVHGPDEFYDVIGQHLNEKIIAADFIVCISDFARSQLMRLSAYEHWNKLFVSRLGIDPAVFAPRLQPVRGAGAFEVLCVGRLTPSKGQHILVDAVARMVKQGRNVRLRVVGGGVDEASLQRHAAPLGEHVVFEGAVNQDRIRSLYAAADCFCLPSFAEGIPVVLMEAMAMQIPCVTTHITGIPELIRDNVDGLLVAPSDVDGLVAALCRLMDDPALCIRLGLEARKRVSSHYDLTHNVQTLATLFQSRLSAPGH